MMVDISTLLAGPYATLIKVGAVLVVAVGLFGGGFLYGWHWATLSTSAAISSNIVHQVQVSQPKAEKQLNTTITKIEDHYIDVIKKVPQIVTNPADCDIGPDAIKLLNDGRNVSTLTKPDAEEPATTTSN
jgi:hypothetical protein